MPRIRETIRKHRYLTTIILAGIVLGAVYAGTLPLTTVLNTPGMALTTTPPIVSKGYVTGTYIATQASDNGYQSFLAQEVVDPATGQATQVVDLYYKFQFTEAQRSNITYLQWFVEAKTWKPDKTASIYLWSFTSANWVDTGQKVIDIELTTVCGTVNPLVYMNENGDMRIRLYAAWSQVGSLYVDYIGWNLQYYETAIEMEKKIIEDLTNIVNFTWETSKGVVIPDIATATVSGTIICNMNLTQTTYLAPTGDVYTFSKAYVELYQQSGSGYSTTVYKSFNAAGSGKTWSITVDTTTIPNGNYKFILAVDWSISTGESKVIPLSMWYSTMADGNLTPPTALDVLMIVGIAAIAILLIVYLFRRRTIQGRRR